MGPREGNALDLQTVRRKQHIDADSRMHMEYPSISSFDIIKDSYEGRVAITK
jgi:hypothetical protein